MRSLALLSLSAILVACGSKPLQQPSAPTAAAPPPVPPPLNQQHQTDDSVRANVEISEDIKSACGLADSEAFFAYDSSTIRTQDRAILKKLTDCFTTGPLKGRQMRIVGHADPRGDDDYNYLLGQRRADNVKSAIVDQGMPPVSVATTSRGENDATGIDEAGWTRDRRVEIVLGG